MIYIDFDGVILDTEKLLFAEWKKIPNRELLKEEQKIKYIQNSDWSYILNNSEIINNSILYLNNMDPNNTYILTKIHSLKEKQAKEEWVKKNNIKQQIIFVPYYLKKADIVDAKNNILIDDCLKNLDEWESNNGKGILFDIDNDNYDSWQQPNNKGYEKVLSLSKFSKKY